MRRTLASLACIPLLVLVGCGSGGSSTPAATATTSTASTLPPAEPAGTVTYSGLSQQHVDTDVVYPQIPPVGGEHSPVWQTCRFYDKPIRNEHGVHSMEHGAVWITYAPDLPAAQIGALKSMEPSNGHLLISPFPGLPAKVVASAWGKQLLLDSVSDPRLGQFVAWFESGPQTPEEGATCQGGTTATQRS